MKAIITILANAEAGFVDFLRISIFVVMAWIGALKAFSYEAEGIVPFVANSPFLRFFYNQPRDYSRHMNMEGQMVAANIEWHEANGTYLFAKALGVAIVLIGALVLAGIWLPKAGLAGGLLTFIMSITTLSFLITTPESFVPALGGADHGFPFLSGAGRLVVKDLIMMAGGLICAADSAKEILHRAVEQSVSVY